MSLRLDSQNLSITASVLISISQCTCIKASPVRRSCPISERMYVFSRSSALNYLSTSDTGMVASSLRRNATLGRSMARATPTFFTMSSEVSVVALPLRNHRTSSARRTTPHQDHPRILWQPLQFGRPNHFVEYLGRSSWKMSESVFLSNRYFSSLITLSRNCLLYTSPSPRDLSTSRMPSSA